MQNKFYKIKKIFYKIFNKVKKYLKYGAWCAIIQIQKNLFTKGGKEQA